MATARFLSPADHSRPYKSHRYDAASNGLELRYIGADETSGSRVYLDNWGRILRDLAANRRFVSAALKARVREIFTSARPLSSLSGMFPDEDPVLLRSAAYQLLHNGKLRCSNKN